MSSLTTVIKAKARLAALKVAITLLPAPRPLVLLGSDSAKKLCTTLAQLGASRVLIVTDPVLHQLGVIDPLVRRLRQLKVVVSVFDGVKPDPTFAVVDAGLAQLQREQCNAVLAVGGGSSIDAAKVIALAATNGHAPKKLVGILKARQPSMPLYVIPTTAGTGSEVTVGAVISDDITHQKGLVIDPKVVPVATALDPKLMQGMPAGVTADTGIDALTHALEAWVSDFANAETDAFAGAATKLIFENLPQAYADGSDLAAREAMALASHYAGLAINQAGLGYVHAIAHQLGAHYGVPHGRANAIVLPFILDFNAKKSATRLAALARWTGLASDAEADATAAATVVAHIKSLLTSLGLKAGVKGAKATDFDAMIKAAFAEAHGTYAVPKYMSKTQAKQVLEAVCVP